LLLTGIVLAWAFDISYLIVLVVTIALYIWFTFKVTEMAGEDPARDERAGHRRQPEGRRQPAELRDGEVFRRRTAGGRPLRQAMEGYEAAAIKTSVSLAFLNFGQSLIITTGLVIVMVMAAIGVKRAR
jgi:ABC-type transport system involved in Fe-S cluster assembly fused permease/ATPase subunit